MQEVEFEKLVQEALQDLPQEIREKVKNVALVVEDKPNSEQLRKTGVRHGTFLLGLYEGVPETKWGKGFGMTLPDKITIFQESIEKFASSPAEIQELVRYVVWHEIAHHFGFNEKGVRELEEKWRKKKN